MNSFIKIYDSSLRFKPYMYMYVSIYIIKNIANEKSEQKYNVGAKILDLKD